MENDKEDSPPILQEGIDYYMEDDLFVLTEHYLRNRGYCCGNGCRHCPYQVSGSSSNTNPED